MWWSNEKSVCSWYFFFFFLLQITIMLEKKHIFISFIHTFVHSLTLSLSLTVFPLYRLNKIRKWTIFHSGLCVRFVINLVYIYYVLCLHFEQWFAIHPHKTHSVSNSFILWMFSDVLLFAHLYTLKAHSTAFC